MTCALVCKIAPKQGQASEGDYPLLVVWPFLGVLQSQRLRTSMKGKDAGSRISLRDSATTSKINGAPRFGPRTTAAGFDG